MNKIRMGDISDKHKTLREARARAVVIAKKDTIDLIKKNKIPKGDCLALAHIAGIQAAKNTSAIIPLCHPINITDIKIDFKLGKDNITVTSTVKAYDRTGVEMEAMSAVSVAALSIYDMCKPVDRAMQIKDIKLIFKSGGESGTYIRK